MNKKTIIIGAVAVVVALIAVVVATQWARLKTVASVAQNATMNEEQVTAKSSENEQIVQELEHEFRIPSIELTPEMQAAIADGSMTLEEAASQFLTAPDEPDAAPVTESDTAAPVTDTTTSPEPVTDTATAPVAESNTAPATEVTTPEPKAETPTVTTPEPKAETPPTVTTPEPKTETPTVTTPEPKVETPPPVTTPEPEPVKPAPEPEPEPTAELSGVTEEPQQSSAESKAPQQSAAEKAKAEQETRVQNLFAQLYVLRASFNTKIDNLIGECIQEFLALDPSSQTRAAKIRIVYNRMDDVTAMEADCDAQVESIAAQLDEIDPALGAKARQYYKNEKDLKKASLIETYGK